MQQLEFFDIPSPCIGVCESGPKGFCKGCFRSRDERVHWHNLPQDVKQKIIKACGQRKKRALYNALLKQQKKTQNSQQQNLWDDD